MFCFPEATIRIMSLDGKVALKETQAWAQLQKYFNDNKNTINIKDMFASDPKRFDKFSIKLETPKNGPFLLDYSKNKINEEVGNTLCFLSCVLNMMCCVLYRVQYTV